MPSRAGMMLNGQGFTLLATALRAEAGDTTRAALLNVVTEICRSRQPHSLSAGDDTSAWMTWCPGATVCHPCSASAANPIEYIFAAAIVRIAIGRIPQRFTCAWLPAVSIHCQNTRIKPLMHAFET